MRIARATRSVILAPERAYEIDAISLAVLRASTAKDASPTSLARSRRGIARRSTSSRATSIKLLQGLADKRLLRDGPVAFAPPPLSARARSYAPFAGGPAGLLAELTHRCPLQCPYCSNPLELERANAELTAANGAKSSARRRRSARCNCIFPAASRPRAAISKRFWPSPSTRGSTPISITSACR